MGLFSRSGMGGLAILAIGALGGCMESVALADWERFNEDFHYTYPLQSGGTVSLDSFNGSVEISGWDQNRVEIGGTKYASSKARLDEIRIEIDASGGAVRIHVQRPERYSGFHGNSGVKFSLRVPRKALLDRIATSNGSIHLSDVDAGAHLHTTNGGIRVTNVHGNVDAESTNGPVEAAELGGNAELRTTNGNIKVDSAHGSLDASTSNGSIEGSVADAPAGTPVRIHSTNGHLDLRLAGSKLPEVHAETTNSSITLRLPPGANASLRATSRSGVNSDFAMTMRPGTYSKGSVEGDIGGGGPEMDLSTTNGSIKILKQ